MPSLVAKTVRGRKYWQIVESRRVNGQPRSFVLAQLGRPETLLARLRQAAAGSAAHRAVAALWAQVQRLGVIELIDAHFWDQMDAVPAGALAAIEEALVRRVVAQEGLAPDTLFYDTTNFFTFIASGNARPTLPRRGHNKQKRHDLRQLGLARSSCPATGSCRSSTSSTRATARTCACSPKSSPASGPGSSGSSAPRRRRRSCMTRATSAGRPRPR
jgi:hypothetical protein